MKRMLAYSFCALLLLTSPSVAEDAAITVCETVLKSELKTPKSYERVEAIVSGLSVFISYDAVNVYNAPIRNTFECSFSRDANGKFGLLPKIPEEITSAVANLEKRAKTANSSQEFEEIESEQKRITNVIAKFTARAMMQILVAEDTKIQPIEASKTSLREE